MQSNIRPCPNIKKFFIQKKIPQTQKLIYNASPLFELQVEKKWIYNIWSERRKKGRKGQRGYILRTGYREAEWRLYDSKEKYEMAIYMSSVAFSSSIFSHSDSDSLWDPAEILSHPSSVPTSDPRSPLRFPTRSSRCVRLQSAYRHRLRQLNLEVPSSFLAS